jgi:poly-gamma-glutamate synthesis protein (capsule biosynthesis protein)
MKFSAVGDVIIGRRIQKDFKGYGELAPVIEQADARFFNLETTLNREGDCPGAAVSGGTYIRTEPEVLYDLMDFGFNMTTACNNHLLDFSYEGLYDTIDALDESGIVHAGIGYNLSMAAAPKYLETSAGRVALIAVNTSFNVSMMAGEASDRVQGRAGINGLRVKRYVNVTKEDIAFIRDLAERTNINAEKDITRREGYYPMLKEDEATLGDLEFKLAEKTELVMEINKADLDRVKKSIEEAEFQADYVIVSVHSHQISGTRKEEPAKMLVDLAHFCIDSGANAVVGHGPHLLRPINWQIRCVVIVFLLYIHNRIRRNQNLIDFFLWNVPEVYSYISCGYWRTVLL